MSLNKILDSCGNRCVDFILSDRRTRGMCVFVLLTYFVPRCMRHMFYFVQYTRLSWLLGIPFTNILWHYVGCSCLPRELVSGCLLSLIYFFIRQCFVLKILWFLVSVIVVMKLCCFLCFFVLAVAFADPEDGQYEPCKWLSTDYPS